MERRRAVLIGLIGVGAAACSPGGKPDDGLITSGGLRKLEQSSAPFIAVQDAKRVAALSAPEGFVNRVWNGDVSKISDGLNPKPEFLEKTPTQQPIDVGFVVEKISPRPNFTYAQKPLGRPTQASTVDKTRVVIAVNPLFPNLDEGVRKLVVENIALQVAIWDVGNSVVYELESARLKFTKLNNSATDAKIARTVGMQQGIASNEFRSIQLLASVLPMLLKIANITINGTPRQREEITQNTILGKAYAKAVELGLDLSALQDYNSDYFKQVAYLKGPWTDWASKQ